MSIESILVFSFFFEEFENSPTDYMLMMLYQFGFHMTEHTRKIELTQN